MLNKKIVLILAIVFFALPSICGAAETSELDLKAKENSESTLKEDDLADFELMVVAKQAKTLLAMYNTLSGPVDLESLARLGDHCYEEVNGESYKRVLISWFLPGQSKSEKPWAITNFSGEIRVIEILDEELANKFPAQKFWNQKGHRPIR